MEQQQPKKGNQETEKKKFRKFEKKPIVNWKKEIRKKN